MQILQSIGFFFCSLWTFEAQMNFTYFELDCTFEILNSYVTCILQLVIKNIPLPLGFIAGVEESSELYKATTHFRKD